MSAISVNIESYRYVPKIAMHVLVIECEFLSAFHLPRNMTIYYSDTKIFNM